MAANFDENVKPTPPGTRVTLSSPKISRASEEIVCPHEPGDGFAVEFGEDDASDWAFF
jgi:hypothetical protein